MAQTQQLEILDTILGSSSIAIRDALSIVGPRVNDLSLYDIDIANDRTSDLVFFIRKPSGKTEVAGARLKPPSVLAPAEIDRFASTPGDIEVLDRVHGRNFMAILAAMTIFERHNVDLSKYKVEVMSEGKFLYVVFSDKDQPEGTKGSAGEVGFEVKFEADNLKLLRSNFIK